MKAINLLGASGSGKTTVAYGLTYQLRIHGYKVEYVPEYAKHLVMSDCISLLKYQEKIFGEQLFYMEIMKDKKLDFIVLDSPILLSAFYCKKYQTDSESLINLILDKHKTYDNLNFFLNRGSIEFDPIGRTQTSAESMQDQKDLKVMLQNFGIDYIDINHAHDAVDSIVDYIKVNL